MSLCAFEMMLSGGKKNCMKIFLGVFHVDSLLPVKNMYCKLVSFFFFIPYSEAALIQKSLSVVV